MKTAPSYPIDNSAILYLAQMGPDHTNVYRFSLTLAEPVCPELLQQAADRICPRFPTIFAGFREGIFSYAVIPAVSAPRVQADPGLLKTMTRSEMNRCAYRIYYDSHEIAIEAFHALTDGYGAIASFRTLAAEYLFLRYGIDSPERSGMLESGEPDWQEELRDAYLDHAGGKPSGVPNRQAYQLTGENRDWRVKASVEPFSTRQLLDAAKESGISVTAMLSGIMAEAIMELQRKNSPSGREKPVRIMVPIDLRRKFPSRTLRNFILYALPTMEPEEAQLPRRERLQRLHHQLRQQTSRDALAPQIARNVRLQASWCFRMIPLKLKCFAMRLAYRFFGECNSSITLTNLGPVPLSEELKPHIQKIEVHLTPRRGSPYNCALISCGDTTCISITRFGAMPELEELFFSKLRSVLEV
ncbi:MAG: hypothetical protein IJE81_02145 [Oscillospiraceae bacterium]|nr:hypothetical protein [Oscillospiraceae bacterium]MBQ7130677.1 hypothetical protein [Oscillospiraceae bacterium]